MTNISNSSDASKHSAAVVLNFPPRSNRRFDIVVERERDDLGWLVITHDRRHGWSHGDYKSALHDAAAVAVGFGVSVVSSAGRVVP